MPWNNFMLEIHIYGIEHVNLDNPNTKTKSEHFRSIEFSILQFQWHYQEFDVELSK